jgi:heme/copper-type cytochrome/quinol oxidase subunit 2
MLKRGLLTLMALMGLLLVALVGLLPLLVVRAQLDAPTYLLALSLWVALAILVLIPVCSVLIKKIWFFRGSGDPVALEALREQLLAINTIACPVAAVARRNTIIFTWRYQETQWCEMFSRLGLNRLFELHCRFDADSRTVILVDRLRLADFLICPERVKIGRRRIPLPLLRARSKRLATIAQYATLEAHDYDFHPREIKSPVMGTILACGWNIRFSVF